MENKSIFLTDIEFQRIVETMPLISIDLIFVRENKEVLLGLRNNRPAQHFWFVPGGRIYKNETRAQAMSRILTQELQLDMSNFSVEFIGPFEHFYPDSFAGDFGISTHYVVLAYRIHVPANFQVTIGDKQHQTLTWWPIEEALSSSEVHQYSKDYINH
ncbi:MAG: NUDIX domain-containing protein [Pseudomonadota bacterium]